MEFVPVYVSENVFIHNVENQFIINGKIDNCLKGNSHNYLFLADENNLAKRGILAAASLVSITSDNLVPVQVIAVEGSTMLYKNTRLGWLQKLQEFDITDMHTVTKEETKKSYNFLNMFQDTLSSIEPENRRAIEKCLQNNIEVFSKDTYDLGTNNMVMHNIKTNGRGPIAIRNRRIPEAMEQTVNDMVEKLIKSDIIEHSTSSWCFPLVLVRKSNGDTRMCVDYRQLNAITERPIFPIPEAAELFDTISGSSYFSTLDMSSGYYQVPMNAKDREKTAFSTKMGHFQFKRMPFGLSGAPSTFQRLMSILLRGVNWKTCVVYLDDILVFGKTVEEHNLRLEEVLKRFKESGLKLSPSKCKFLQKEVIYLGHIIDSRGVRTDPAKISAIQKWQIPSNKAELMSFIGLCNYYRRFVNNYADSIKPLQDLANEKEFIWTWEHTEAFRILKVRLCTTPVLSLPRPNCTYILDTDASFFAMGAVLSQIQDGVETVISYASNQLTKSQKQFCITRKELLSVHTYMNKFKHYLMGQHFIVRTDHRALLWILNWEKPNTSQFCLWKADLEIFDFEIQHRQGKNHVNADALSRIPACGQCELHHFDPKKKRNVKIMNSEEIDIRPGGVQHAAVVSEHSINNTIDRPLNCVLADDTQLDLNGLLDLQHKVFDEKIKVQVERLDEEGRQLWKNRQNLVRNGNNLYVFHDDRLKMFIPVKDRDNVLYQLHNDMGHPGIEKTAELVTHEYYWPNIVRKVTEYVKKCELCMRCKDRQGMLTQQMRCTVTSKPFERIGIDICGPFSKTKYGHSYILVVVDYFSKFCSLIPLKSMLSKEVAFKLWRHWLSVFGMPLTIMSDHASNFQSKLFSELCDLCNIKQISSSPFHHESNGQVERLIRTIKPMISALCNERKTKQWDIMLPSIELCVRASKQKSTGITPYETLFGRCMTLPVNWRINGIPIYEGDTNRLERIELLHNKVMTNQLKANEKQENRQNGRKVKNGFVVGDFVYVMNWRNPAGVTKEKFIGPYKVVEKIGTWTYILEDKWGRKFKRCYNQLKQSFNDATSHLSAQPPSIERNSVKS